MAAVMNTSVLIKIDLRKDKAWQNELDSKSVAPYLNDDKIVNNFCFIEI